MAKFKALKKGFTNINSTDISNFSIHSDYKCQKIASVGSNTVTLPSGSSSLNGNSSSTTIYHGLGYIPEFFAFVEYNGKGYEAVGNANPQIPVQQMQFFAVDVTNNYIITEASGSGTVHVDSHVSLNDVIQFTSNPNNGGVLPSPLQPNTNYYVKSIINSGTFTVSLTQGGPIVDITNGGGTYNDIYKNITHPYFGDTGIGFNIIADTTNLNITAFPTGLNYTANNETFTIRAFFILDQII